MRFECETIEKKTRDGAPLMRGVEWTESTMWETLAEKAATVACAIGGGGGLLMLFAVLNSRGELPAIFWFVVCMGILVGGLWGLGAAYHEVPGRPRALHLHADGVIKAPHGLGQHGNAPFQLRPKLADIGNVEVVQLEATTAGRIEYTHGVRFIAKDGAVIYVARNLEPDQALTLAKRLTNTIALLRFDLGEALKQTTREVELVID